MAKGFLTTLLALSAFVIISDQDRALAQEEKQTKPATDAVLVGVNGKTWNGWSKLEDELGKEMAGVAKYCFVRGVYDGLAFGASPVIGKYYTQTSIDHLVRALDQFYADYRNEKVVVVFALEVISMELRGEPREKIDLELQRKRKIMSEISK